MPTINIDVDVDLDEALRYADHDDVIDYVVQNVEHAAILDKVDQDSIRQYALDHCNLVEED